MPPVEMRVGQAMAMATGSSPTEPATGSFTVSPGGHSITPSASGNVQPPQASHFHGHASPNMSHSPVHVFNHTVTSEAWQGYHAAYVWPGTRKVDADLAFLPSGKVDTNTYDAPHVVFPEEKPGPKSTVDTSVGAARTQITEVVHNETNMDFSNNPQNTTQISVETPARVVNLFLMEEQTAPAALNMGGPIMARVA
jgi:hypothetical protein